jgi:hypothetical protein
VDEDTITLFYLESRELQAETLKLCCSSYFWSK